ncbi:PucR-like helix-turn-helix protein [Rhodococcus sp. OK519]|uniref:PucR family transcriptional regulator n=1 Tax=Rhodococcus sp. OK519 TaxID=2135729 RepID=UPI000D3A5C60|nr:PucR-like helix-turn-helix protein [Rhodococcus sp. OK519]
MDRLLAQLSSLDAGAEAAVRVVAAFDRLMESRAPVGALTRATAGLAKCPAGISRPGHAVVRYAPNGDRLDEFYPDVSPSQRSAGGISVWLERSGLPHDLDDLLLERFALAARALIPRPNGLEPRDIADPALVEVLIAGTHCPEDRARAIKLLGLDPNRPVRVVAVATTGGQDPEGAAAALVSRRPSTVGPRVVTVGPLAAVLLQPRSDPAVVVSGLREVLSENTFARHTLAGVGTAVMPDQARQSWLEGKLALRFAEAGTASAVVDHDELGAIALLADIPSARLAANPDVLALVELTATDSGRMDLEAVEALCRTGSLRQAAASLHMHHSTVATRISRAELKLGWDLNAYSGTLRVSIALHALKLLRDSANDRIVPRRGAAGSTTANRRHPA